MKLPNIFVLEKDLGGEIERLSKEPVKFHPKYAKFGTVSAANYAKGIAKLKEQGRKPFTFSENIEARIIDYKNNGEDSELFMTSFSSVTGIVYKAHSTKFKLIVRSDKLENISLGSRRKYITVNYNAEQGVELDSAKGKYGEYLTRKEAKNHEFWLAVMNGDKEKLTDYVDMWFDKTGLEGMGVYLISNTKQNELRSLVLDYGGFNSSAYGRDGLSDEVHFVSCA
ncbi:MAG: hypothetical protein Q8O03_05285 [Nanoarchaeota archaeon]|nr:hypothetical protein [Nanoarchaeota archaeon]